MEWSALCRLAHFSGICEGPPRAGRLKAGASGRCVPVRVASSPVRGAPALPRLFRRLGLGLGRGSSAARGFRGWPPPLLSPTRPGTLPGLGSGTLSTPRGDSGPPLCPPTPCNGDLQCVPRHSNNAHARCSSFSRRQQPRGFYTRPAAQLAIRHTHKQRPVAFRRLPPHGLCPVVAVADLWPG